MHVLLCGLALLAAGTQQARAQDTLESQLSLRLTRAVAPSSSEARPNEIVRGSLSYSGIAVAVIKADNPLQLLNPLAAAKYGSGEDNALRDVKTGRVSGWKLFSIRF